MTDQSNKTLVVPVDFSKYSLALIGQALSLANNPDDLRLIHVLPPLSSISPGTTWGTLNDEKRIQSVKEHLDNNYSHLNISSEQLEVRVGSPGFIIAEFAKEVSADLIVIATHGHHGLPHLLLGSVTERVIREAPCDVYVSRAEVI